MFDKILIACQGASAVHVLQACRELRIQTVAIHCRTDAGSRAVQLADESVYIGPGRAEDQFHLHIPALISAARTTGADAIHPGDSPLAQSRSFPEICADYGIKLIGPGAATLTLLADRPQLRRRMQQAGLPVIPGAEEAVHTFRQADEIAQRLGYPVVLKLLAGTEGRSLAIVRRREDLEEAFQAAQHQAQRLCQDRRLHLEKYLEGARLLQVPVLCDGTEGIHLGECEATVRLERETLITESPSPHLSPEQRQRIGDLAVRGALAAELVGAGVMQFLLDTDGNFYSAGLTGWLPEESPVVEMRCGLDLVREQLRLASGERLRFTQQDVAPRGHAFACQVRLDQPGGNQRIETLIPACGPGVRFDTAAYSGWSLPPFYDPLIARLAVWAEDRSTAMDRMLRAVRELTIDGVRTNLPFYQRVFAHPAFRRGDLPADALLDLAAEEAA